MSTNHKIIYTFKKGQKVHLDSIYEIQGLGPEEWWEHDEDDNFGDEVIITKDVTITVITKYN